MTRNPTFCEDCDHVEPASRKRAKYYWLCLKHKRLEGAGFVARDEWVLNEPFLRCKDCNGGLCEMFSPRRDVGTPAPVKDEIPYT